MIERIRRIGFFRVSHVLKYRPCKKSVVLKIYILDALVYWRYKRWHYSHIGTCSTSGRLGIGLLLSTHVVGWYGYYLSWLDVRRNKIEHLSTQLATFPILCAEKDRAILKHIKRLRDVEEEVMEDFPYWEVGTYFGVPVYESLPKNVYVEPLSVTR